MCIYSKSCVHHTRCNSPVSCCSNPLLLRRSCSVVFVAKCLFHHKLSRATGVKRGLPPPRHLSRLAPCFAPLCRLLEEPKRERRGCSRACNQITRRVGRIHLFLALNRFSAAHSWTAGATAGSALACVLLGQLFSYLSLKTASLSTTLERGNCPSGV